jgi:UDPglucose--hexose-1-phosphate uridylyltransferase
MSELRKDPVTGGWVIFAPERSRRPLDPVMAPDPASPDDPRSCPFCPGHESQTASEVLHFPASLEYPGQPWSFRVVEDRYPLLSPSRNYHRYGEGMYDLMDGFGFHELLVESPVHTDGYHAFGETHVRNILHTYQNRSMELGRNDRVRQVLITGGTERDGEPLHVHPHSHIVALPIVPKRIAEEAAGCLKYYQFKERCLYCDIIHQETDDRSRLVLENEGFVAFCAYAGRFPHELVIAPRAHSSRFELIRPNEIALLAEIFKAAICGMQRALDLCPMHFIVHTSPTPHARREELADVAKFYHWHIEVIPRLTRPAGFEWGSGFYINPTLPEDSARTLREHCARARSDAVGRTDGLP